MNHKRHNDKDRRRKTSLTKYVPLTLFVRVRNGLLKVCMWEGAGVRMELQYFRALMAVSVVSFSFSRAAQPEARRPRGPLHWVMALSTASYQYLLWSPIQSGATSPFGLVWHSLPHLIYNSVRSLTATNLTSALTELYNSSTPTQSPSRSLKSHV